MKVPGRVIINRRQLLRKVPMSDRTIFEMEKRGEFPQRFSITARMVGWDLQEVDDWIARQHQAALPQSAPGQRSREPAL
ncbi:AlpA family phage regulatory protein [Pseudoduganella albidiflava]|uniref:AlpA family phage regulatory protein n=1 Tax=Pseudoduganella albidiflava TaxID=321983 RepID=A0ABX5S3Z0_9BURK|nr:AlpA family phage regulatory protein [Pseudoduganella albidiflava]